MPEIDIEKTEQIVKLCQCPQGDRNAEWMMEFSATVPEAAFRIRGEGEQQIMSGPDGFPYLLFFVPPRDQEVHVVSLQVVLDVCLTQGAGIAIYPEDEGKPLWVFTYGNLLAYKMMGTFNPPRPTPMPAAPRAADRQVMAGQPSETFLPAVARPHLRRFLELYKVNDPSLFLLNDVTMQPAQQLVFNVFKEDFETEAHFHEVMTRLTWYLPPSYGIVSLPYRGTQFDKAFAPI